jgi:two-component system LytT family sensor kinase
VSAPWVSSIESRHPPSLAPKPQLAAAVTQVAAVRGPLAAGGLRAAGEARNVRKTTVAAAPVPPDDDARAAWFDLDTAWFTLVGCGAAVAIGTAVATQVYLSMRDHGHSFLRILGWHTAAWCFWGLAAAFVLRLGGRLSSERGRTSLILYVTAVGSVLCVAHMLFAAQLSVWFEPFMPIPGPTFAQAFIGQLPSVLLIDVLVFVLLVVAGNALGAHQRTRHLERRESRLEVELARAQLEALRLEIHPHFLFNTLNSIAALIRVKDNPQALEMVLGLSELMRATVDGPRDHLVPLSTEIDFVRRYADLQRTRFADRLDIDWDVDDASLTVPVPTLLLQPLVENAIRHGAAARAGRCRVTIAARLDSGRLHLRVRDDGVGLPAGFELTRDAGTGLRNTGSRLQQLYGSRASFEVRAAAGGGVVAEVILPATAVAAPVRTIA